jgi:hypothetical protein
MLTFTHVHLHIDIVPPWLDSDYSYSFLAGAAGFFRESGQVLGIAGEDDDRSRLIEGNGGQKCVEC